VIHLYTGIARRKGESGDGIIVSRPEVHADSTSELPKADQPPSPGDQQEGEVEDHNSTPGLTV